MLPLNKIYIFKKHDFLNICIQILLQKKQTIQSVTDDFLPKYSIDLQI